MASLTPVLGRYQDYPEVALVYASLAHFTKDYDGALARLESLLAKDDLSEKHRAQIHFNLGRLFDMHGDYAQAFAHYRTGNQLTSAKFDVRAWQDRISNLIDIFSHDAMMRANSLHVSRGGCGGRADGHQPIGRPVTGFA